jgi:hypothetical protein
VAARLADAARTAADVTRNGAVVVHHGASVLDDLMTRYPVLKYGTMGGQESAKGTVVAQQEPGQVLTRVLTPDERALVG